MKKLFAAIVTLIMAFTLAACGEQVDDQFVDITLESDLAEAELSRTPEEATEGMDVTVTASEVDGYDFVRWIDADTQDELSTERTFTFVVEGPITLEAVYEETADPGNGDEETYSVNVTSDLEAATLSLSQDGPFDEGEEITVEASEVDTYNFVRWVDADTDAELSTDRTYTFNVDQDLTLKAVYEDALTENERTAQTIVDGASEDTAYLDTVMEDFDPDEGMTMTMHMAIEEYDPETEEVTVYDITIELATETVGETRMTKLSVHMDMPDMPEPLAMTMFMEEDEDTMTLTMDAGMILDMFENEEEIDMRTLLDMDSDYVYLSVPKDLEGTEQEIVYEQLMEAILVQMFGPDHDESDLPEFDESMMETLFEHMDDLKDLLNFSQISTYDEVDLVMERDGHLAIGTLSIGGAALRAYAEDLFEQVYTTLEMLDEEDELMPYEDIITTQDYNMIMGAIGMIPEMTMTMEYDAENEVMHMDMDVYTLLNFFMEDDPEFENVEDITMEMTMEKGTTIADDLSDAVNLEVIAKEIIQAFTVVESAEYLGGIAEDGDIPEGTHTLNELAGMGHPFYMPFIDLEESVVTVDLSGEEPLYSLTLHYTHNQEPVFADTTVTIQDIGAVLEEEPTDRQDMLDILALVDDENFELYPVLAEIMQAVIEEAEEEWSNPLPEEDEIYIEEPGLFDRYPGSIVYYHELDGDSEFFLFAAEAQPVEVRDHFVSSLDTDDWVKNDEHEPADEEIAYELEFYNTVEDHALHVMIHTSSMYDDAIDYHVSLHDMSTD